MMQGDEEDPDEALVRLHMRLTLAVYVVCWSGIAWFGIWSTAPADLRLSCLVMLGLVGYLMGRHWTHVWQRNQARLRVLYPLVKPPMWHRDDDYVMELIEEEEAAAAAERSMEEVLHVLS